MATFYYNGFVDTDWATLGNWWTDSGFSVAATSLPTITDDVEMWETVDANTGGFIAVHDLAQKVGMLDVILTVTGLATFENDTSYGYGTLTGNATFNGNSTNPGTIVSSATTALLLHFNGSDSSTTFTDSSPNELTATANGSVQISTAQSVFGSSSAVFNGGGDNLAITGDWTWWSTSDYTIEFWLRANAVTGYLPLVFSDNGINAHLYNGGTIHVNDGQTASSIGDGLPIVPDTWTHIAIVRLSGTITLYQDGVVIGTTTQTPNVGGSTFRVGGDSSGNGVAGYIDEVRVVKGFAVYTSNFTPPTIQLGLVGINFNGTSSNGAGGETYGDAVFNNTSSNAGTVNDSLIAALTPTFGTPTPTSTGFTVQISNYDAAYTWAGTATASGSVAINGTGLVTVTGVAALTSSTAMITTSRAGYVDGVAVVTETSLSASSVPVTFANSYHAYNTSTYSVTGTSTVTASLTGASGTDGVCDSRLWLLIDVTGTLTYTVTANSEAGYDGGRLYSTSSAPAQHDFNGSGFAVASIAGLTNVSGAVSGSQTSTGTVAVTAGDYLVLRYTKDSETNDGTNSISATLSII